jgi:nucleoside-diphosphate-sugar epimerase
MIVVTGCAGFLGSNLVGRLLDAGNRVLGIDNLSMGSMENLEACQGREGFTFRQADVTDATAFGGIADRVEGIVHLAAFKIPRYGKALDTLRINYRGTEQALEFATERKCKIVVASTSDVYGRNPAVPFSEDQSDSVIGPSTVPRWAYAVSKLYDEHLALAYEDAYGLPVTVLRFFGSYGPGQNLTWWGGPQSVFIDCVLRGKPIPVHGDGRQTRSFTYVSDTVEGIYQALVRDQANGQVINIGSAEEVTILDLATRIHRLCGGTGEPRIDLVPYESFSGKAYQDVMRRVPDVSKCERLLGVRARVGLDEGLGRTIEWQRGRMLQRQAG